MKKEKEKNEKALMIVFIFAFISVAAIILWVGLRQKEAEPEKQTAPEIKTETSDKEIYFASNGRTSVYKIKKGDKWSVIWNGTEGKEYDYVSNPTFSPDGTQLAYSAELDGQAYVVVNNQFEINAHQRASFLVFSRDGKTIAFVASNSDGTSVVVTSSTDQLAGTLVSGNESQAYEKIVVIETASGEKQAIVLGETGNQIAYAFEENGKTYLIINGNTTTGYDNITNFTFNENGTYSYQAQQGNVIINIVNGVVVSSTNSGNASNSNNNSNNTNNDNQPNKTGTYKYRISTDKDIDLPDDRLDYPACASADCNF